MNNLSNFNIFVFLKDFAYILFNWCDQLYNVLRYNIEIDLRPVVDFYFSAEVWQILGVGGIAIFLIIKVIKSFF